MASLESPSRVRVFVVIYSSDTTNLSSNHHCDDLDMRTRGYRYVCLFLCPARRDNLCYSPRVYHYRGYNFVHFNQLDSYPEG